MPFNSDSARKATFAKKTKTKRKTYRCPHCGCDHVNDGTCAKAKKDFGVKFDKGYRSLQKRKKKNMAQGFLEKLITKKPTSMAMLHND